MKQLIGNTPLLEINFKYKGEERIVYAKAEYYNVTGSVKDRMAYHIINESYKDGSLKKGMPIIEATSGNTGIAMSAIGAHFGHKVEIFMPDWMSKERKDMIKSYGAVLHDVSPEQGGFIGSIKMADEYSKKVKGFRPQQFDNPYNIDAHYKTTGPEIINQLKSIGLKPESFVAGVGTGGTITGVSKCLKEFDSKIKAFPLEPSNSPTLTTGHRVGKHRIQGISDEFIPKCCELDKLDDIIMVDDGDSIIMAQKLARILGLGVGISSGANFLGAIKAQEITGKDKITVTIFSDDSKKYLSTDYTKDEPVKEDFLSTHVELLSVKSITL